MNDTAETSIVSPSALDPAPADPSTLSNKKGPFLIKIGRLSKITKLATHQNWFPVFLFALAMSLRALYDCVFLEHRIAHFGDAYNFLRSGSCIYEAFATSNNLTELLAKFYAAAPPQAQILQSMTSMKLADRLIIDGPVYPGYLAIVQWLIGIDPKNPIFDGHTVQITLCNAFIDSLVCVLVYYMGRLAFNRKVGTIAAILFAFYPGAIINTQHCYSEPFSYFLLSAWTAIVLFVLLRNKRHPIVDGLAWMGIGLTAGMLMLSKPAFVILPPAIALELITLSLAGTFLNSKTGAERTSSVIASLKKFAMRTCLITVGAAIVLTPWVFFNKSVSGQYSIFVNRVPSFNIFHGNQLKTDGWRCYPYYGTFPGDTKHVVASLIEDAKKEPLAFVGLQFKKIARLWSGVWNEYHYKLFGFSIELQSLFHQLILLLGTAGLSLALIGSKHITLSRRFSAGIVLGTIALFHFVYIPFEAISRYAITAIPSIIVLGAFLIDACSQTKSAMKTLLIGIAISAIALLMIAQSGSVANFIAGFLPESALPTAPYIASGLAALLYLGIFICLRKLFVHLSKTNSSKLLILPGIALSLALIVSCFYTMQSFDWKEWGAALKTSTSNVVQTIELPATAKFEEDSTTFVLCDLDSEILGAPIVAIVNDVPLEDHPQPLAQMQPNNKDILQCLAIQGEGMSRDLRTFRNWWVIRCPNELLKPGVKNSIVLMKDNNAAGFDRVTIYGDYPVSKSFLPSLRSFSYTKGFTTFDHRDPRVFEKQDIRGRVTESILQNGHESPRAGPAPDDLSGAPGKQTGEFRIRFLTCSGSPANETSNQLSRIPNFVITKKDEQNKPTNLIGLAIDSVSKKNHAVRLNEPINILGKSQKHQVIGQNPATFIPPINTVELKSGLPPLTRFYFTSKLQSLAAPHPCFVSVAFEGTDTSGKTKTWTSQWLPIGINIYKDRAIESSFGDIIPTDVLNLKNLHAKIFISPFQPDLLFLRRKQALKASIVVTDAKLTILPPLAIPEDPEARVWTLY